MIKMLFFDLNSVICDDGFREGIKAFEKRHGFPRDSVYKIVHDNNFWRNFTLGLITEKEYIKKCREGARGKLSFNVDEYIKSVYNHFKIYSSVAKLVKELSKEFDIGVASNTAREWYNYVLKKADLYNLVKFKGASSYLHIRKENPEFYKYILNHLNLCGDEIIFIDDRDDRLAVIKKLGIKTILFKGKTDSVAKLKRLIKKSVNKINN